MRSSGDIRPTRLKLTAERNVSEGSGGGAAAHAVLVALHPDQQARPRCDARWPRSAHIAEGDAKVKGIELGKKAAAEILALRANDGAHRAGDPTAPTPSPASMSRPSIPVSSTYGASTPWVMAPVRNSGRLPPPAPELRRPGRGIVNEIRDYGGRANTKRSAEQTDIGRFWFVTGPQAGIRSCASSWRPRSSTSSTAPHVRAGRDRDRRCLHRGVRRQVSLQFLAAGHRDPQCGPQRQHGDAT